MIAILLALLAVVNVPNPSVSYACDGSNPTFTVSFPYLAKADLTVTSTVNSTLAVTALAATTDWTVNLASTSSTATLTLSAPATSCPSGSTLKIARNLTLTQPKSFKAQSTYNQSLHEEVADRLEMQIQQVDAKVSNPVSPSALTNATLVQASNPGSTSPIQLQNWFAFATNAQSYGAVPSGSDISANLNSALSNNTGIVYLPPSATCYNIGTTTILPGTGRMLVGGGMGGPSAGPTCMKYTGTGCAISLDSVSFSAVANIDVQLDTTSATARALCVKSTTGTAEFNLIDSISARMINATRRTAGQVGLLLQDFGNSVYWNTFRRLRFSYWDTSIKLVGNAVNGVNANHFEDLMSWGHVTAIRLTTANVFDNRFFGIHCSRSDGTWVGTANCLMSGDDNTTVGFNKFYDVTSDQGAPSTCATFGTNSGGNILEADCQSGGPVVDNYNAGTFHNRVYQQINGSFPGLMTMARLTLKNELSLGVSPAQSGDLRFSNNQSIRFRNAANGADMVTLTVDTNDRLMLGTGTAFLRFNNNIVEHGTGTVANSGNERFVSSWTMLGRNAANNANVKIGDFGSTVADVYTVGDPAVASVNLGTLTPFTNATLGTPPNGTVRYCSDCTIANPCAGAGNGALAKRLNGIWVCN